MGTPTPGKQMWENKNVFDKPLHLFSREPLTGAYRDGYCRTGSDDPGNHTVAATVTQEFLDFTQSKGNSLPNTPGVRAGVKWCLCSHRWKEAMQAAKDADDPVVPKVHLHATAKEALKDVDLSELKKYAAEGETGGSQSGRAPRGMAGVPARQTVHEMNKTGGFARDEHPDESEDPDEHTDRKMYSGRRG